MEKLDQLLENEAFLDKIYSCESEKEIADTLTENGIEISEEEVKEMLEQVSAGKSTGGELDETALEGVSGGGIIGAAIIGKIVEKIKQRIHDRRSPGIRPDIRPNIWGRFM